MQEYTIAIDGHLISVTATATALTALIDAAAGAAQGLPSSLDELIIQPEDGDIRFTADGSIPTTALGELVMQNEKKTIVGISPKNINLIRVGGSDVSCNVRVGWRHNPALGSA